jgi:hypothetical protein
MMPSHRKNPVTVQRDDHMQATGDRRICFGSLRRHFGDKQR